MNKIKNKLIPFCLIAIILINAFPLTAFAASVNLVYSGSETLLMNFTLSGTTVNRVYAPDPLLNIDPFDNTMTITSTTPTSPSYVYVGYNDVWGTEVYNNKLFLSPTNPSEILDVGTVYVARGEGNIFDNSIVIDPNIEIRANSLTCGKANFGDVSNNEIIIGAGSKVNCNGIIVGESTNNIAKDNYIVMNEGSTVTGKISVGETMNGSSIGNTLKAYGGGQTIGGGFDYVQILEIGDLPATTTNGTTAITSNGVTNVGNIEVKLAFASRPNLEVGDKITLVDASGGSLNGIPTTTTVSESGYTFSIDVEGKKLVANVTTTPKKTVTFDANGGTVSPASTITGVDGKLTSLPVPTKSEFTFNGWFTAATGGTKITADYVFTADATVYAQWTEETSSNNASSDNNSSNTSSDDSSSSQSSSPIIPNKIGDTDYYTKDFNYYDAGNSSVSGNSTNASETAKSSKFTLQTLTTNNVSVTGKFTDGSKLVAEKIDNANAIVQYNISIDGSFEGAVDLSIPVDPKYNGKTLEITHITGDTSETFRSVVKDGFVNISVTSFSPFIIKEISAETNMYNPKTGTENQINIIAAFLAICSILVTIFGFIVIYIKNKKQTIKSESVFY